MGKDNAKTNHVRLIFFQFFLFITLSEHTKREQRIVATLVLT